MYSIRYLIKKDGSQIALWNNDASRDISKALEIAYKFGTQHNNTIIMNSGWIKEDENFYRMKIVYASASPEETNFALHITVGHSDVAYRSNL